MNWIFVLTLMAITAGCSDCDNSHREYIIAQSQAEREINITLKEIEEP